MYFLMRKSKPISPFIGSYSQRKEFATFGSKFLPLRVTPNVTVSTIKLKNKKMIFYLSEGMENCKMSGKNQGKSGNFVLGDKWQPCILLLLLILGQGHKLKHFL